jgi:hypothetical protein
MVVVIPDVFWEILRSADHGTDFTDGYDVVSTIAHCLTFKSVGSYLQAVFQ